MWVVMVAIGDHIVDILVDHGKASCAQASEAEH